MHIAFWIAYLVLEVFIIGFNSENYLQQFELHLFYLPVKIFATYINIYYIIPKAFLSGKHIKYISYFILTFVAAGILQRLNIKYVVIPIYDPALSEKYDLFTFGMFIRIFHEYYIVIAASAIKILKNWYESKKNEQLLKQEKLENELNFLKGQIHPHFLFNTLNNLYVLTKKKSDLAPEIVLKLSDILDYILYECNAEKISVDKEINIIKSLIDIESIRHGEELTIKQIYNHNSSDEIKIPPLLLLPLVENSFKHGVNNHLSNKNITIKTYINDLFFFEISNNYENLNDSNSNGIGLTNLKRRLELLFNNDYYFETSTSNKTFTAKLGIPLNE